jgi:hypothetical protein
LVRENVFGDPVTVHLALALDVYTHSICAFRLALVSGSSVDVAMVLRDVMLPLPMREEWGEDMEWPYPGLPAAMVSEFAGYEVAGLPFFTPETVTSDHGSVYRNHHLVDVQEAMGCRILSARVLRPQGKAAVERVFGGIRSLVFEKLPGYPPRLRCESGRQSAEPLSGVPSPTAPGCETRLADWSSVWSAPCGSIVAAQCSAQRARGFRAWRASCPSGVSS